MRTYKIVITGGPCAGKTTAMSWIQNHFSRMGYTVLFVPETATELISGGVAPWTCGTNLDYQKCQVKLQLVKEQLFEQAAATMGKDKILIVCDRGFMDNKAYMTDEEFDEALASVGGTLSEMRDQYDAVFHLVTAAKGAEEFYTLENNAARYETVEEARALDDKLIACWTGHPHFRIIDNSTDFEDKLKRLINEMISFLGEPEPISMQRKYLIEYPDVEWLEKNPYARKVDIWQTYIKAPLGEEYRIRKSGENGHYTYYENAKKRIDGLKRLQQERRLTEDQYVDLLRSADPELKTIEKTRYYLSYDRQYFQIDLYDFWEDQAIAEIVVSDENAPVRFPDEIKVIKEVTDDLSYKNIALASRK
ncbi:MAG: AAA family ATPase [Solobacterium sp.]|nr:AAA family ATPase [Solobacterium sp.]